ncbi:MAG: ATP synthase F1 subunit gamma [Calditrichaeota bacterium]|jgi:F-type H+-transporting ATPase subunit gamma|nr:ATP synthase F1 subunit gamma [Calditrichota bacterium]MBT7618969.1 ATP synthase F1 subunit gamma [Calditrichota bacterium]MBT7789493.1 ATP synthase F1 subunit gamma [Calditrichota bacterium]
MASLKHIRQRIVGISNTRQITRAMKMVAAANMRRAQENMEKARPYSWKLRELIGSLAAHTDRDRHPLLSKREAERVGVVCVTSDRGLAGGFNAVICRRTQALMKELSGLEVELITLGKKGQDFFNKREVPIYRYFPGVFQELNFNQAISVGTAIAEQYVTGNYDRFYIVYNEFKNAMQQNIVCEQLLPIEPEEEVTTWSPVEYIYEPDAAGVLQELLPRFVNIEIWQVLLESFASEQAARMAAMENATKNADDIVKSLKLQFNKARQAAITKELSEIVAGAEGLK